jgi:hypothetical protein
MVKRYFVASKKLKVKGETYTANVYKRKKSGSLVANLSENPTRK